MKIVILCAGPDREFDILKKPRHLYHVNGTVQLLRFLEPYMELGFSYRDFRFVVRDKEPFEQFFKGRGIDAEIVVNRNDASAIYSYRVGLEGLEDSQEPILVALGDEIFGRRALKDIISEDNDLVCFRKGTNAPDPTIFKIKPHLIRFFTDDIYLSKDFFRDRDLLATYFSVRQIPYPQEWLRPINTGVAMGYMIMHAILNAESEISSEKCSFLRMDYEKDYGGDLDHITQTDEYKKSFSLKVLWFMYRVRRKLERLLNKIIS